jgi:Tfp pilus assembly protein FimV
LLPALPASPARPPAAASSRATATPKTHTAATEATQTTTSSTSTFTETKPLPSSRVNLLLRRLPRLSNARRKKRKGTTAHHPWKVIHFCVNINRIYIYVPS